MSLCQLEIFDVDKHATMIDQFVSIHRSCVLHDHQLLTFLDVSDSALPKLRKYWTERFEATRNGTEILIMSLDENAPSRNRILAGFVILQMSFRETGPFRAFVMNMMVSLDHRRRGIARRLLSKLEEIAKAKERYLLMLDTAVGTEAESSGFYQKLGYIEYGVVPNFGISPVDGRLTDEKFFYKDLRGLIAKSPGRNDNEVDRK